MVSFGAGTLASVLVAAAMCAGAVGWLIRREQERSVRRAHEASIREQMNAAGKARDRARDEAQEIEDRFQRLRPEIAERDARLTELEATLESLKPDLAAARESHAGCGAREAEFERIVADLRARVEVTERQREQAAPGWLLAAPEGSKDDLKAIRGLGPVLEREMNRLGIFHFHQLARMTSRDVHWIAGRISAFPGLNKRYRWADQAREMRTRPTAGQARNGTNGRHAAREKPLDSA